MDSRGSAAKLYGAMPAGAAQQLHPLEEDDDDHDHEQHAYHHQLGDDMDGAEYFEYVQWEGGDVGEEAIGQEAPAGHVMMRAAPNGEEVYADEDFNEYVEFNDEEDAKRYLAKMQAAELMGGDGGEEELIEEEEAGQGPSRSHVLQEVDLDEASRDEELFEMYAAPTTRRRATIVQCEICGVVLKHPSKIRAHMRTHTGERPFECAVCGRTFTQRTPWRMHEKRHAQDLQFPCSYGCGKAFPIASQRNAHDLRHSGRKRLGPPRPHLKPVKKGLLHGGGGGGGPVDPMLEAHEAMMDDLRGPPIVDAQLFAEPAPLSAAAHKRIDEVISAVAENRAVCPPLPARGAADGGDADDDEVDGCSPEDAAAAAVAASAAAAAAARRERSRRAPAIVAECQICGLMLKHPSKIQAHMRSHTGVKPFRCKECGLAVATLYALRMHTARKHGEGERPLPCTWECGRRFVSVSSRNEHERIVHAGIKRYECTVGGCRRLFSRRCHVVAHRLKDHPGLVHVDEFDDAVDMDYLSMLDEESGITSVGQHHHEHRPEGAGLRGQEEEEEEVVEESVDGHVMEEAEEEQRRLEEEEEHLHHHAIADHEYLPHRRHYGVVVVAAAAAAGPAADPMGGALEDAAAAAAAPPPPLPLPPARPMPRVLLRRPGIMRRSR